MKRRLKVLSTYFLVNGISLSVLGSMMVIREKSALSNKMVILGLASMILSLSIQLWQGRRQNRLGKDF